MPSRWQDGRESVSPHAQAVASSHHFEVNRVLSDHEPRMPMSAIPRLEVFPVFKTSDEMTQCEVLTLETDNA